MLRILQKTNLNQCCSKMVPLVVSKRILRYWVAAKRIKAQTNNNTTVAIWLKNATTDNKKPNDVKSKYQRGCETYTLKDKLNQVLF
jgi:hypothetical protein